MFSTVLSAAVFGVESRLVHVEADVGNGLPGFYMVGYLSAQVKEAQERVRTALKNSGYFLEPKRIAVNLAPADVKKSGSGFDLPIAVAVAAAYGEIPLKRLEKTMIAGELSLNGEVNGIMGILPIAADAASLGCEECIVPAANAQEGAAAAGMKIIGVHSLKETIAYLKGELEILPCQPSGRDLWKSEAEEDFQDIAGQEAVKRAVEVAVSGFHNLLLIGPPGAGKSMVARRITGILPPMSMEERMEISRIYSVAGMLPPDGSLLLKRPFRAPHHTITAKALAGGGNMPRPGEISLAHNGVLFLDELPEFQRETLEVLRQPLEDGQVIISRTGGSCAFPSNIMLVAAMNPCPCGCYPDMDQCSCTYGSIKKYLSRISAPLLDRMDMTVEAPAIGYEQLKKRGCGESSEVIRKRVTETRRLQEERYGNTKFRFNGDLDSQGIEEYCSLGKEENDLMREAYEKMSLSARSCHRILKVARTIADMEGSIQIGLPHLQEALCYRTISRRYWMGR